jgi:drug/metabolite transporter (DMT)-like permease
MSSLLPLLGLFGASLAAAGFDLSRKLLVKHLSPLSLVVLLAAGSIPLFAVLVALAGWPLLQPGYAPPAVASVALNLTAHLCFLRAIAMAPLSTTVPLLSLTPVFASLLGWLVLGETIHAAGLLGIVCVVAGTLWLQSRDLKPAGSALLAGRFRPAVGFMAVTAFCFSLAIPLDKLAVSRASAPFHGLILTSGIGLGSFLLLAGQGRWRETLAVRRCWKPFGWALATSTLTLGLQLVALQFLHVGVVETVKRGVGNLAALVLGRTILEETWSLQHLAAALLMASGVALILL